MKKFFRFLLVFVCVILFYIYNNPVVIDKYKTAGTSTERDSSQCSDSTASDTDDINVNAVDSTNMKATASDSLIVDSIVVDTLLCGDKKVGGINSGLFERLYRHV